MIIILISLDVKFLVNQATTEKAAPRNVPVHQPDYVMLSLDVVKVTDMI